MSDIKVTFSGGATGEGVPRADLQDNGMSPSLMEDYDQKGTSIRELKNAVTTSADAINGLSPKTGTQSPEGVITSNRSQLYYRVDGSTKEIYFNPSVGVNTGWLQMT